MNANVARRASASGTANWATTGCCVDTAQAAAIEFPLGELPRWFRRPLVVASAKPRVIRRVWRESFAAYGGIAARA